MAPLKKKRKLSASDKAGNCKDNSHSVDVANGTKVSTGRPEQQRRSLFIRCLPASATSESLTALFSESYPVKHATAVVDPATKQCRGYGFVTFADAEDAQHARDEFNGHALESKKLLVDFADPRQRDEEKAGKRPTTSKNIAQHSQDVPQPSRLIVRNLPWSIKNTDQLAKLFLSHGKVKSAYVPRKGPGLSAGFGFVVLRGRKNAEKALQSLNGKEVDGRTLAVDWAVSKDVYNDVLRKDDHQALDRSEDVAIPTPSAKRDKTNAEGASDDDRESMDENNFDDVDPHHPHNVDRMIRIGEGQVIESEVDDRSSTIFVRNLPFTCSDEDFEDHFSIFGSVRYARVVMDQNTERSRGTGFVCFYSKADADECLRNAPKGRIAPIVEDTKKVMKTMHTTHSILQDETSDPSGRYTLDGRILQLSRAVEKSEADRLTAEGVAHRRKRNEDRRRLYLLSEGTISHTSPLWEKLSPSERTMRQASEKQRKALIESNPSLHLSLTRLSVRNIPRSIGSKELKALAREAVVGFAADAKNGLRQRLSKEELDRGGEEMEAAEQARKRAGKGLVKQAKIVFEGANGSKISEANGAGRSRGYGFIEYYTHRSALMGLRWLNGHAVGYQSKNGNKTSKEELRDRKRRLIAEFALDNAQVVMRRGGREQKARERSKAVKTGELLTENIETGPVSRTVQGGTQKRKRDADRDDTSHGNPGLQEPGVSDSSSRDMPRSDASSAAKRNYIIGRKRAMRKVRKDSK